MNPIRSPLRRSFWYCAAAILLYAAAFSLWHFLKPGSPAFSLAVNDLAQLLGPVLMVPFCLYSRGSFWKPRRASGGTAHPGSSLRWASLLLGLSLVSQAIGLAFYASYEIVLHQLAPFPSWADAGMLGFYPLLLLAILFLPARHTRGTARVRVLLDGLMIMTAVVTFSWYFLLGPLMSVGNETTLARLVGAAYPSFDLVLIFCLLLLSFRTNEPVLRPAVGILSIALLVIVTIDSLYDYQTLHGVFEVGSWLEIGWLVGYMLLGLAAQAMPRVQTSPEPAARSEPQQEPSMLPPMWRSLLPYVVVPAVGLLALAIWHIGPSDDRLEAGVYLGGAVLVGLVLLRQIVATWETASFARRTQRLNAALHATQAELRVKNQALSEANRRLESLATTDPLTGLPNHRAFIAALEQELARSQRYGRSCALLFLDLDHFKAINDGYGHQVGDALLRECAATLRTALRGMDTLGRWGGEEFVVLLPETGPQGAQAAAEALRAAVAAHVFAAGAGVRLTCSIGIASAPADVQGREDLVTAADRAMYGAKMLGRNQVRAVNDPAILALAADTPGSREDAALVGTVEALTALIEARDHYTGQHTCRVSALSMRLALALGLDASEAYMIGVAGRLHDIGKVAVPDAVLQKPARLTEEETALMQKHTVVGGDVVSRVPSLRAIAPLIRAHHEQWDGTGYPDGLVGAQIPLGARIIAVADAYEAMTTDRPYQSARDDTWALAELRRCAGTQFDSLVVAELERVFATEGAQPELARV